MAGTVWKGALSVGLLSIAVRLYSARERHGPTMHQFVRGTDHRVRNRRVDEETGDEVPPDGIVKGALVGYDEYVILEPQELAALMPGKSRTLEISAFIPSGAVDPLWYANAYFISPADRAGVRPYRLLHTVLEETGRVGLATMVMREREHLVLVGPQLGVLTAATLYWPDEVRSPADVMPAVPREADLLERDLGLARQLVDVMADDWQPAEYEDVYARRVDELISAKSEGRTVSYGAPPGPSGKVVQITEALRETLEARRGGRAPAPRSELTKKELLRRAQELGVPGRSKMSRDELEQAVQRASA
ncbi:Ku protein [Nocardiopsis sp. YSL2]|uniref:non-homologous end joining protein Ku n=1 Tax=Nocardiopsis sp. YSL2 TaxID=2939492 RepID=UPI0026F42922|nr:Ku protein [Nocardiopsis sp. YSL2]